MFQAETWILDLTVPGVLVLRFDGGVFDRSGIWTTGFFSKNIKKQYEQNHKQPEFEKNDVKLC